MSILIFSLMPFSHVFKSPTREALYISFISSQFPSLSVQKWRSQHKNGFLCLSALSGSDSFSTFNLSVSHSPSNLILSLSLFLHILSFPPISVEPFSLLLLLSSQFNPPNLHLWSKAENLLSGFDRYSHLLLWVAFKTPPLKTSRVAH